MLLMFISLVALSRLDASIWTMLKWQDIDYTSFLAMAIMLHSLQVREGNFISSLIDDELCFDDYDRTTELWTLPDVLLGAQQKLWSSGQSNL
jgi:hypothetical protein